MISHQGCSYGVRKLIGIGQWEGVAICFVEQSSLASSVSSKNAEVRAVGRNILEEDSGLYLHWSRDNFCYF